MSPLLTRIILKYFIFLSVLYIINAEKIHIPTKRVISTNDLFANKTNHMQTGNFKTKKESPIITKKFLRYNFHKDHSGENISKTKLFTSKQKDKMATQKCVLPISFPNNKTDDKLNKNIINTLKDKKVIKLLCIIYILVAVPLWCTKGWCCCFLCCKIFKPEKTIEEAKKFLELNPPGVLLHKGTLIHYESSASEKYCYEKFEHLIRTI